jgi:hypothetical protein
MIWKGWQKKMLWFVVLWLLIDLDDYLSYIIHHEPMAWSPFTAVCVLGLYIVPLFFLKDDEE